MKLHNFSAALLVLAAWPSNPSQAQFCLGSDNLLGPCCSPAFANLPTFPSISMPGMGICWSTCNPTQQPGVMVALATPAMTNCGQYTSGLTVTTSTGALALAGTLDLDYTRTWFEIPPSPANIIQVWRFAAKGDLSNPPPSVTGCPVPACLTTAVPTAFFYGYVDFAIDCVTGNWSGAVVLYHGCDRFMHGPLSAFPGLKHPGISYAIVAPVTSANPFIPGVNAFPSGPLVAEAVRDETPPLLPAICKTEEPLINGLQLFLGQGCACPLSFGTPQHSANFLQGSGSCPDASGLVSGFTSVNVPGQPWLFEVKTSIGMWVNPLGSYPGDEVAWVDEGVFNYYDSCTSFLGGPPNTLNIFYGASTAQGFPVQPSDPGTLLTDKFIDLASNFTLIPGTPPSLPAVDLVLPTHYLFYANVP